MFESLESGHNINTFLFSLSFCLMITYYNSIKKLRIHRFVVLLYWFLWKIINSREYFISLSVNITLSKVKLNVYDKRIKLLKTSYYCDNLYCCCFFSLIITWADIGFYIHITHIWRIFICSSIINVELVVWPAQL